MVAARNDIMTIIKFPSPKQPKSGFFDEIEEDGYHVFSLKNAKIPGYYPNQFPDYPGVSISDLKIGDAITIRVFFKIGTGSNIHVDGGYIDLEVEFIDGDVILAGINTLLPDKFPLKTGGSLEIFEDEILYKVDSKVN